MENLVEVITVVLYNCRRMLKNVKFRFFAFFASFLFVFYLSGCASGQYEIGHGDIKDTTKFKSTGAKLKNFYKIKSPPYFTLQVSVGPNLGMAELSSNYSSIFDAQQFEEGQNFGVKTGFGAMVIGKFSLHQAGNLRLTGSGGFNRFQSDFFSDSSPYGDVNYNVLSVGIGLENSFSPSFRLKPFIAGEIQANMISGDATINDLETGSKRDVTIKGSFRIGYMLYSGVEYMINDKWGLNLGLKVTNANQVLKSSSSDGDTPDEVSLRDKKVVNGPLEFGGFKNFTYTTLFFGVNFYMGVHDIVYQFNK